MGLSVIDFSAQFGGRDAAAIALPHFKALKAAAQGLRLEGFQFPELAFILRVDGEVNQYGFSGLSNLDIDRGREYISIDIGIKIEDRNHLTDVISAALLASGVFLSEFAEKYSWTIDFKSLQDFTVDLVAYYLRNISSAKSVDT